MLADSDDESKNNTYEDSKLKKQYYLLWDHPEISIAELESLNLKVNRITKNWISTDVLDLTKFGSIVKTATHLATWETRDNQIEEIFTEKLVNLLCDTKLNKKNISINLYGFSGKLRPERYQSLLIRLKHLLAKNKRKTRIVLPKSGLSLSNPQIQHNKLIDNGLDINLVISQKEVFVLLTKEISDFSFFRRIDNERPNRDLKVGQLSPRLSLSLINLAKLKTDEIVYDPFCGSGTILQMGLLNGFAVAGSDISEKMVRNTMLNLEWLNLQFNNTDKWSVWKSNALEINQWPENNVLVTEGFLGFKQVNKQLINKLDSLYSKLFNTLAKIYPNQKRIVICLPYWEVSSQEKVFLPVIDKLNNIGFNSIFNEGNSTGLLYRRQGQNTGHQILVLEKN